MQLRLLAPPGSGVGGEHQEQRQPGILDLDGFEQGDDVVGRGPGRSLPWHLPGLALAAGLAGSHPQSTPCSSGERTTACTRRTVQLHTELLFQRGGRPSPVAKCH
ncbi:MAG: hypothetical protein M3N68_02475 [Actinomycetota bacterium]|nr:hypothetical protein [Actinomycetota bacterium]